MDLKKEITHKPNGKALFPLAVFFLLYILTWIFTGDLGNMPVSVAFLTASFVAIITTKGKKFSPKVDVFCRGAASNTILLMILIFIMAGAFAATANAMGAVDATVKMVLYLLPENMIPAGIFLAACFISLSMGTSCGTIAALAPIAVGLHVQTGIPVAVLIGIVVGGSMFGDNLSFISDTTVAATRTQGCRLQDKFKVNIRIVLVPAIMVFLFYIYQGIGIEVPQQISARDVEWIKVLPYLIVLITALAGVNVVIVLGLGILLAGTIGLIGGSFSVWDWTHAMSHGIVADMGELIIVSLMAGGMFEVIRYNGGIDWLILKLTKNIRSRRKAEGSIAALVVLTDFCTANNTIAIIIAGPIAKKISDNFHLDNRRIAGLLDTFSCFAQAVIPYGAQLLIASGLAKINPVEIIPYLYYPFFMAVAAIGAIVFQYPKKYLQSQPSDPRNSQKK